MARFARPLIEAVLFLVAVVPVRAQGTCSLTQITNTFGGSNISFLPAIDAAGDRVTFASNADLVGNNGDGGFEVFLWDASTGLTQITNINAGSFLVPSINAAGSRIAFVANTNPLGTNGDGNYELFLWDASTGLTQVTNSTGGGSFSPKINAAGTRIVFDSNADLVGSNGDGNFEIFLWDSSTGFTQITNTTGFTDNTFPTINASGTRIAFGSDADLLGTNPAGNFELFLWDASTGLAQITSASLGVSQFPAINAVGNRIAFVSSADLTGGNGDTNNEIFLWDASTGFTQITNTTNFLEFNLSPAINAAGTRISFESNADLLGNGGGHFEIFLWDASSGISQITDTDTSLDSTSSSIDAAGTRIAFGSSANLSGSNSDGNQEIFLASCAPVAVAAVPAVSPLGLGVLTVLLGLAAAWTLRRRRGPGLQI